MKIPDLSLLVVLRETSTVSALGYFFFAMFFGLLGLCGVRCETDFVPFLVNFDQNNTKEGRLNYDEFDKLKLRGLILMVK